MNTRRMPLHGENISKLVFGFFAGVFGSLALRHKVFNLGFDMKAQLIFYVRREIGTQQAVVAAP